MRTWGIRILIIAVIAVGAFILRDRISSNAGDLAVGDCFDDPGADVEIEDVQHHPCTEPHDNEVLVVTTHSAANGAAYPADADFETVVATTCVPAFQPYTGRDPNSETELDIAWFVPTNAAWEDGNRKVICYLYRLDKAKLTAPLKTQ